MMETVKFGIIGCGLMGKEFASAAARWLHVRESVPKPEILAVCDVNPAAAQWFTEEVPSVQYVYTDYKELLQNPEVEAVYCAVPHVLHKQTYVDIIDAGKHFMGEKPFGMDLDANQAILDACQRHPASVIRCASEFPFFPAAQLLIRWVQEGRFGRILEVHAGLNHSSDMDRNKPINWKRTLKTNGEYGCMGDLGLHTQHIPFRLGWIPQNVCAKLCKYVTERPDGKGGMAPCETWDNATLICDVQAQTGEAFPMFLEMKRMKPGATNDWYIEVDGMDCSARFASDDPNALWFTQAHGREQAWCRLVVGSKPLYPTITGNIFEFGFSDSILQMWVAFMKEVAGQAPGFGCIRPEETAISHRLHTAALESQRTNAIVPI
ncbi:MAG: Gfo/Idh/MocA family oxidoreductase [Oscillospiraceae bacterium]|nr:Gfo/Idh/MocA family oxidoreductase [Oscillospiraceae bacterium]